MKLVEDTCEKLVLTPINVVTFLSPINRKYKIFTSYSYIKKKKKKEQQQILEIHSFPLSGTGEEQVPCMEFKHLPLLGGPLSLVQTPPKWGTLLLFNLAAKSFKIPFCPGTVAQSNILLVQGSPSRGDSVTYFNCCVPQKLYKTEKKCKKELNINAADHRNVRPLLALALEVYLVNEEMENETNNENHILE